MDVTKLSGMDAGRVRMGIPEKLLAIATWEVLSRESCPDRQEDGAA